MAQKRGREKPLIYSASRLRKIFSLENELSFTKEDLLSLDLPNKNLTPFTKHKQKSWHPSHIPSIGEAFGFIKSHPEPLVFCTFITKGGVLKSSLTLNFARMAALHNIKTCVIGLDMQGDITSALGYQNQISENCSLNEAVAQFSEIDGLPDYYFGKLELEKIIVQTELPTLSLIPETPELVAMEQNLNTRYRRETWLKEQVIQPLKKSYDLILLDCSPNWNQLITNALVASDVLLSPLECKINNFRNLKMFTSFISDFKSELQLNLQQMYIPTRWSLNRKLSCEIKEWYQSHLPLCTKSVVRDSVQGEESMALHLSVPEYAGSTPAGLEMKKLIHEIWKNSTNIDIMSQTKQTKSKVTITQTETKGEICPSL